MSFEKALEYGLVGESRIAEWLKRRGWAILPVYEQEKPSGKGPRVFTASGNLIAPDMVIFKGKILKWIEAKHKTAFTWHRKTQRFVTGIDIKHYEDYLKIADLSPFPIWLLFLQEGGQESPSGLYGGELLALRNVENHRHQNWGKSGMVYWAENMLTKLADLTELNKNG